MGNVAWIGLGSMGAPMAQNLIRAGHSVTVYDLMKEKCDALEGAQTAGSCAQAAEAADWIFLSVPDPAALSSCILGEDGVACALREGQVVVDMSTVSIEISARCDEAVRAKGGSFLCAPVGGGTDMAQAAQLTVMCSGSREAYERTLPLFQALSRAQYYLGEGYGARAMKLAHNMMIAVNMQMLAETLTFCKKAGVDQDCAMDIIRESALNNSYLSFKMPEIRDRSFRRTSMPVKMLAKDLRLAMDCAEQMEVNVPVTQLAGQMLDALDAGGYGDRDPSWLVLQMEALAGLDPAEMK